jgi:hypothetical protein
MIDMIAGGLSIASGLVSGLSGRSAAKKQKKAYKAMARKAREIGKLNVAEIERTGVEGQKSMLDQQARRAARIESMYAKSGNIMSGTPAVAQQEQKRMDQYALNEYNQQVAFRAKLQSESMVQQYLGQAKAAGMQGTNALIGGLFGAAAGAVQFGTGAQDWLGSLKQSNALSPITQQNGMNYSYGTLMNNQFDPTSPVAGRQQLYHR